MAGAVACALCCGAFPISGAAADSDFTDFRIPKNRALLWTGGLNADANGNDLASPASQSTSGSLNGRASTQLSWFSDSDPAFTSLFVNVQAQGQRGARTRPFGATTGRDGRTSTGPVHPGRPDGAGFATRPGSTTPWYWSSV